MSIAENQPVNQVRENISWFARQAVKLVPIVDYVKIRYDQQDIDEKEIHLLLGGAGILGFNLVDERDIPSSKDLRVKWARGVVEQVPFSQYLFAKREAIVQAQEVNRNKEKRQALATQLKVIDTLIWKAN